jgi:arylsulfatase A-like enzyme
MKIIEKFCSLLLVLFFLSCDQNDKDVKVQIKPNIIYILADDLGYGDLGSYGQKQFKTPNIDRLAEQGILFSQHYAGASVCAPSRSVLMAGLHSGHTPIRGNKSNASGQLPLPEKSITIAEILKQNGYATAGFGKWGLGSVDSEGSPLKQGFDIFFGYNDQRLAHHYYPDHLWDNDKRITLEENKGLEKGKYAPSIIHEKALSFIESNKETPFFLFYPTVIPHAELFAPEAYMDQFRGQFENEKPYLGTDKGEYYKKGRYGSQSHPRAAFAAMITLLDDQVGDIMAKVKELGLEENTIIVFTSDNGPHKEGGADPVFFNSNGNLKGFKRDLFEGGIRVPMIVKWKGKIKEGTKTNHTSAFWDVMPTLADILNVPLATKTDGISFLPSLLSEDGQQQHDYLYWEFHELGGRQAVRKDNWKLVKHNVKSNGEYFLFNLDTDPGETKNLSEAYPNKLKELITILEKARNESEDFKF